jgi:hypothetical protein
MSANIAQLAPGAQKICPQPIHFARQYCPAGRNSCPQLAGKSCEINSYRPAARDRSAGKNAPGPPDIGSENHDFKR